jgi:hypothetical protein
MVTSKVRSMSRSPHQHGSILSQISCPHCWQRSKPHEIKWISAHPSLRDDPRVPDGQRRFLPTRFHVNGQAIDSMGERCSEIACPRCHLVIPRDLVELPVTYFSILGSPSSGKSYFLASSLWKLRTTLSQRFALSFEDSDPVANHKLLEYEESLFLNSRGHKLAALPKTEMDGDLYEQVEVEPGRIMLLPRPFIFRMRTLPAHPQAVHGTLPGRAICLYDNAGEHFLPGAQTANSPGTRHLSVSKALLFLFDPTQHPSIRRACEGHSTDPQIRSDNVSFRQDHILNEATRRIRAELGLRQDQRDKRPLIVVLTKYDAWCSLTGSRPLADDWVIEAQPGGVSRLNVPLLRRVSEKFRGLVLKYVPEIVATAEAFSEDVTYIPVSALGTSPEEIPGVPPAGDPPRAALGIRPENIRPQWPEIPLLYAIQRTIPGLLRSSQNPRPDNATEAADD